MTDARLRGAVGTGGLFLAVQLLALAVAPRLATDGVSYGSGGDALVPLVLGLVVGTILSLAVVRYRRSRRLVRAMMLVSLGVAVSLAPYAFFGPLAGLLAGTVAVVLAWRVPRWEVRNLVAVVGVAGAAGLFGASLSPPYALAALALAAVYDAYAVYVSGHMKTLAVASERMDLPSMFVVPAGEGPRGGRLDLDATADRDMERRGEPAATVLGAGDALFPAMLAASAAVHGAAGGWFGSAASVAFGLVPTALGALVGSVVGFAALQVLVQRRGGMYAGLPFINGGAMLGFLVAALASGIPF
ncbi:presenilin family intramembrane aspartyl protease PSH [Halorarum halobium]|uniref:presenilin family intramembrane aspartyl protease PSH n=1 Tax=Halorarum halobium TaxID=3075121 RepID=UPI0028B2096A|nr:presenilin family intramembrane aspartyl protease PSH [Halobaculum sp. XH14]